LSFIVPRFHGERLVDPSRKRSVCKAFDTKAVPTHIFENTPLAKRLMALSGFYSPLPWLN
tara:strand:- start:2162 stop:2341 length:180 start_codon:yes stop_codon:yes gene_type:complete